MIRYLVGAFAVACACLVAFANSRSVAKDDAKSGTMRFEWRTEGPAEQCGRLCRKWISASGVVTDNTAFDFEAFAKDNDVHGATLVLDSEHLRLLAYRFGTDRLLLGTDSPFMPEQLKETARIADVLRSTSRRAVEVHNALAYLGLPPIPR